MNILITGASGLIGKELIKKLLLKNHNIAILTRAKQVDLALTQYLWNPEKATIDPNCLDQIDTIIHLAGESIAEGRWNQAKRNRIIHSRVQSSQLLFKLLQKKTSKVSYIISASAAGYYGDVKGMSEVSESTPAGLNFLSICCQQWEHKVLQCQHILGIKTGVFRTGLVLSEKGGILKQMQQIVNLYLGAPLASGKQIMPWIHINDTVNAYLYAIENQLEGIYNLNANKTVDNTYFTKIIGKYSHKPILPVPIPFFILNLILGKKAVLLSMNSPCTSLKLINSGFHFEFPDFELAIKDLIGTKE